jgi:predicted nucleic acid-binding protein
LILVDTNILIDLDSGDERARLQAELAFAEALTNDVVAVNEVISPNTPSASPRPQPATVSSTV